MRATTAAERVHQRPSAEHERVRLGLLLSIVLGLTALLSVFLRHSGFVGSDFFSLRDAQEQGLSFRFLVEPVFDHFVPGHRFVNWVLQSMSPLDFRLATLVTVLVFAVSLVVMHQLLAELFRAGPVPVLLTLLYGASVVHVGTALYWAASLSRLPADTLGLASMLLHLRFRRTGRIALLAWSVGLLTLAVLFSEGAALYVLFLLALRVFVLRPQESPSESLRGVIAEARVWAPYLVPLAVTVVGSVTQAGTASQFHSLTSLGRYLATAWFQAFVPALFGQFVNRGALSTGEVTVVVATSAALVGLVAWSIARRAAAWRAWAVLLIAFLGTQVPVGLIRTGYYTPELVAHEYRYYSEVIGVFTIVLGFAFVPVRGELGPRLSRSLNEWRVPRRATAAGVAATVFVYIACSVWTSRRLTDGYYGRQAGPYVSALRGDVRDRPVATVLDGELPEYVIVADYRPYNRLATIVPLMGAGARVGTGGSNLHRVREDGHLEAVTFTPKTGGAAVDLARLPSAFAALPPGAQATEADQVCVRSEDPAAAIGYNLDHAVEAGDWYLRMRYRGPVTSVGHVLVDRGHGLVDAREPVLPLIAERREALVALGEGGFHRLVVILPKNFRLCVEELVLALVQPRA